MIKRQHATLFWIRQLHLINHKIEDEKHQFFFNNKPIRRVRIYGCSIHQRIRENPNGRRYLSMVIDDGTDTIQIKYWSKEEVNQDTLLSDLSKVQSGQIVDVIGKIGYYNNELYITPEIIRTNLDIDFEIERRLQLLDQYRKNKYDSVHSKTDKELDQDAQLVLSMMSDDLDHNSIEALSQKTNFTHDKVTEILTFLQTESLIFMPKLGFYKKLNLEL